MRPDEYATMFRVEETHWWYRSLHRVLFQALEMEIPDWRNKEIVDVGCGTGAILQRLGNPGKNVGVDLSPLAISFCRTRGLNNVKEADICAMPFGDESFDAAICSSVLYHDWIDDVGRALREIHRILRPNGVLLINVPAFRFLHSAHDDAVMTARRFRKPELRDLLVENGFAIRRLTYWTTLLFPLALVARTFGGSQKGRDFDLNKDSFLQKLFLKVMGLEIGMLKKISMPFGVALLVVGRKLA